MKIIHLSFIIIFSCLFLRCDSIPTRTEEVGPPWLVFRKATTNNGLVNDNINCIFVDASNKIWIGTDGGVSIYSKSGWQSIVTPLQWQDPRFGYVYSKVNAITQGIDGSMWFGLDGGGIRRFVPIGVSQTWRSYTYPTLSSDLIRDMATDQFGDIWCATDYGISHFKPSSTEQFAGYWTAYTSDNCGLPSNFLRAVKINHIKNLIWFGTLYGELVSFDGIRSWRRYLLPVRFTPVNTLGIEGADLVWVGTNDGVFKFSSSYGWTHYSVSKTDSQLPSDIVNAIIIDYEGKALIGTDKGLATFDGTSWNVLNQKNSPIPNDTITALAIDFKSNIWIGTKSGIAVFNKSGIR